MWTSKTAKTKPDVGRFDVITSTLKHLGLAQYESAFTTHDVTDEILKGMITSNGPLDKFLLLLIPKIGHLLEFKKEFCLRAGVGVSAEPSVKAETEPEASELHAAKEAGTGKPNAQDTNHRHPHRPVTIGIDLGRFHCRVAVVSNNMIKLIPDTRSEGQYAFPTCVVFNDSSVIVGGSSEGETAVTPFGNSKNTIFDTKCMIGKKFADNEVQDGIKVWPFEVVEKDGEPRIRVRGKQYRPEDIVAKVLAKSKEMAENFLGRAVTKAVITVPVYFDNAQREATEAAAEMARLEATLLHEPNAAVLAYRLHQTGDSRNIVVFDFGAHRLDVTVYTVEKGVLRMQSSGGDENLGGENFTDAIVNAMVERVKAKCGIDLGFGRIGEKNKMRCEVAKKALSDADTVTIIIDALHERIRCREPFTRAEFNQMNEKRFRKCILAVSRAVSDAGMTKSDIHDFVLVGGSARIPKLQEMLSDFFDNRIELRKEIEEPVAWGAAYSAALLS